MRPTTLAKGIIRAISFFLGMAVLLVILYQVRTLIVYLVIAAILALICKPMVSFLGRRLNINRTYGALIALTGAMGLTVGMGLMLVPMLAQQTKSIALYDTQAIKAELDKVYGKISEYSGTSKKAVEEAVEDSKIEKKVTGGIDDREIPTLLDTLLSITTQLGIGLLSVLFLSFFMLKDHSSIQRFILAMMPAAHRKRAVSSLDKIKNLLSRYFVGLVLQLFVLFVIYAVTLFLVGVQNALIVAFFCALFNIVPYAGPVMGAVVMSALTITGQGDADFGQHTLPLLGYVMIGVTVGQLVDNFVSQPFIYSNSVKSNPMEIFVVIIATGLLFGITGMIAAVPAYTVLKVILKEFYWENGFVRFWTKGI